MEWRMGRSIEVFPSAAPPAENKFCAFLVSQNTSGQVLVD